jgi:hypothetical protein
LCAGLSAGVVLTAGVVLAAGVLTAGPAHADSTIPEAPTSVLATPADGEIQLSWAAPVSDGGSAIVEYDVAAVPSVAGAVAPPVMVMDPTTLATDLTGLANGVRYDLAVTAVNGVGAGPAGTVAATPRTVPGRAVIDEVTAGDGAAVVHWSAPADDGGASVGLYAVRAEPSGTIRWVTGDSRSLAFTGLANGARARFVVAAHNEAGFGPVSARSRAVTPRRRAHVVVTRWPDVRERYGNVTAVSVAMVSAGGVHIPSQRVELWARVRPSSRWKRVDAGHTARDGRLTLRAALPANSALRLHHPTNVVAAPDVSLHPVTVANRTFAHVVARHIRFAKSVHVRGRVGPDQRRGSTVDLQRHRHGAWRTVARGHMRTASRYRVAWTPPHAGRYTLRVVKPGGRVRAPGASSAWHQWVAPERAADIARDILHNHRITLAGVHVSGVRDDATARDDMTDLAHGHLAQRSCYQNAPCGATSMRLAALRAIRAMGQRGRIEVSEMAGGSHAPGSMHYLGRAIDIDAVDGRSVSGGANYSMVVNTCRAFGATTVYDPGYDPWGGHSNHVHCEWAAGR